MCRVYVNTCSLKSNLPPLDLFCYATSTQNKQIFFGYSMVYDMLILTKGQEEFTMDYDRLGYNLEVNKNDGLVH